MSQDQSKEFSQGQAPPVPDEPTFQHIVQTFAVPAMIWTGQIPNPMDEKAEPNLPLARRQIGLLEVLEKKTKGNLTDEEEDSLAEMLSAARYAYVRATQQRAAPTAQDAPVRAPEAEKQEETREDEEGAKGEETEKDEEKKDEEKQE